MDANAKRSAPTVAGVPRYLVRQFVTALAAAPLLAATGRVSRALDRLIDIAFAAGYAANRWGLVRRGASSQIAEQRQAA